MKFLNLVILLCLPLSLFSAPMIDGGTPYDPSVDPKILERVQMFKITFPGMLEPKGVGSYVELSPNWLLMTAHSVVNVKNKILLNEDPFLEKDKILNFNEKLDILNESNLNSAMLTHYDRTVESIIVHQGYIWLEQAAFKLMSEIKNHLKVFYEDVEIQIKEKNYNQEEVKNLVKNRWMKFHENYTRLRSRINIIKNNQSKFDLVLIKLNSNSELVGDNSVNYPKIAKKKYKINEGDEIIFSGYGNNNYDSDMLMGVVPVGFGEKRWGIFPFKKDLKLFDPAPEVGTVAYNDLQSGNLLINQNRRSLLVHEGNSKDIFLELAGNNYSGVSAMAGDSGGGVFHRSDKDFDTLVGIISSGITINKRSFLVYRRFENSEISIELNHNPVDWVNRYINHNQFNDIYKINPDSDEILKLPLDARERNPDGTYRLKDNAKIQRIEMFTQRSFFVDLRSKENQRFLRKNLPRHLRP